MIRRIGFLGALLGLVLLTPGCDDNNSLNRDIFFNGTFVGTKPLQQIYHHELLPWLRDAGIPLPIPARVGRRSLCP